MPAPRPVRVVLADDHPVFRDGLIMALSASPEVEIVGQAADGRELLAVVEQSRPHVVLADLGMPVLPGTEAARILRQRHPEIAVLMLTMHKDDESVRRAMRAGVHGYLVKGAEREEIVRAVLTVADGNAVFGRDVADRFTSPRPTVEAYPFPGLTVREREVLQLLATGLGNHEIARRLRLSEKTVRNHISPIFDKLQVRDRAAAVARARDFGIGHEPS